MKNIQLNYDDFQRLRRIFHLFEDFKLSDDVLEAVESSRQTYDFLGNQIAGLFNNPQLPEDLYRGFHKAFDDYAGTETPTISSIDDSPTYIATVLREIENKKQRGVE